MSSTTTIRADALRAAIVKREAQLDVALHDLVAAAGARASIWHYVVRYRWQFLIGAVVAGAWLGHRRRRTNRATDGRR